jgi:hypothetical protein
MRAKSTCTSVIGVLKVTLSVSAGPEPSRRDCPLKDGLTEKVVTAKEPPVGAVKLARNPDATSGTRLKNGVL